MRSYYMVINGITFLILLIEIESNKSSSCLFLLLLNPFQIILIFSPIYAKSNHHNLVFNLCFSRLTISSKHCCNLGLHIKFLINSLNLYRFLQCPLILPKFKKPCSLFENQLYINKNHPDSQ